MGILRTIILFFLFINLTYSQVYKIPVPNVRFGSGVPIALPTDKENDTYIRTDDGLYTGTFLEEYVFDKNYNTWILCTLGTSPVGVSSLTTDYINGVLTTTIDGVVYDTAQIPTSGGGGSDNQALSITAGKGTINLTNSSPITLGDSSSTNEIQTISTTAGKGTINLSLGGGNITLNDSSSTNEVQTVDSFNITTNQLRFSLSQDPTTYTVSLTPYLDNTDAQTLTWTSASGNLDISGGNTVNLDGRYLLSEVDGSTTNEIQTIDTFAFASKNLKISLSSDNVAASNVYLGQFLDTSTVHGGDVTGIYSNLQLGASTVTTTEIGNGEVSTIDLADSVITSAKLISNSVGTTALASGSVSTLKLADSSVTAIKIISNSIDGTQLKASGVTAGSYTLASITVDNDGRITSASNGAGGSGDVSNNGNSFAAAFRVGSNDNNTVSLEVEDTVAQTIGTDGNVTLTNLVANSTATVNDRLTIQTNSHGTAAAGFGGAILFNGESSTTNNRNMGRITSYWSTATDASRASKIGIQLVTAAGALTEAFNFSSTAMTTGISYTIGNSSSALTLGGSSGTVTLSTSSATTAAIAINTSVNSATSTAGIDIGSSANYSQTSGTRNLLNFTNGFNPSSGTAIHNQLVFSGIFNQTGGASGITRNIYLNPTLTAVADFRGIESTYNTANSWHLYQTGSSSKGNTLVKTSIGTTTAPTALLMLAAGTATANTSPLKFTSGTNLTTPEAGAVEYDASNLYITNAAAIRFTIAKMLSGSATLNFGSTLTLTSSDLTITVTGAADGDEVILGVPNAAVNANSCYTAWVSASNTVTVRFNNYSSGSIDPASASFKVGVIKR